MKIMNYISKDLVIGAIEGSMLATIITSIIYAKRINKSNEELKILAEDLEKLDDLAEKALEDQDDIIEEQRTKIKELEEMIKNYRTLERVNELAEEAKCD